jgi:hypothetical protein
MASYPPPKYTEPLSIFNPYYYENFNSQTIDINFINANCLRYPIAQGQENLQAISVNGIATFNNDVNINAKTTITTNYGASATTSLKVRDSVSNQEIEFLPNITATSYNPSITANDVSER